MRTRFAGAGTAVPAGFFLVALTAAALGAVAADCDLPSTLPNGQPIGDLMSHPEFQDKIKSVIKDFAMSSRANNATEVSKWTSQAQLAAQFGMGDGSCPFPHNGWELSADRACGGMVTVAGVPGIQVELSINGRKTECFDDATPTPKGFQIGGLLTFFPPARNLSSARALGEGELLPSSAALTQSAAYCYPLSRKPTTKSGPLKEPALLLLAMHWFGSGLNASCDPDFSILGAGATDLELNILAACETKQTLPNGAGDPLGATTWHLKLQMSKSCTTGDEPVHQQELEGSVTFFDRINDVQTRSVFDITLPPPSPPPPPPPSPPPPPPPFPPPPSPPRPPSPRPPPPSPRPPSPRPPPPRPRPPSPRPPPPRPRPPSPRPPPPRPRLPSPRPPPPRSRSPSPRPPPPRPRPPSPRPPPPRPRPPPRRTRGRLLAGAIDGLTPVLRGSAGNSSALALPRRRLAGTPVPPPSSDETISCRDSFDCVFSTLDLASVPSSFPGLTLTVGSQSVNLFGYFNPSSFVNTAKYYSGLGFCALAVKGSDLASWSLSSTGFGAWSSSLSFMGDLTAFTDIFSSLPAQATQYYLVGAYATGIPGLVDVPGLPGPVEVAGAINFCLGDYLFGFNGLEATVSLGPEIPISVSVALTGASYSFRKAISSDGLGVPNVYWTPSGAATLAINGDVLLTGDVSVELGLKGGAAITADAAISLLINTDPRSDGIGTTPDFAALIDVATAPSLTLLDGALNIDLSAMASGDMTLLAQYTSASNYVFAYRQTGQFSVGSFLKAIPSMPGAVADAIGKMYPSASGSVNFYVSQDEWGLMLDFSGNYGNIYSASGSALNKYKSSFGILGDVFDQILKYVPGFDASLNAGFSISGKMKGNGLPIKAGFYAGSSTGKASLGAYFCSNNGDCDGLGGGASCMLGICASFSCPAGTSAQGLLCYAPCRDGYTNVLGVCWKNCPAGWTDGGAFCTSPGSCPSGQENVAGICYDYCRNGYVGVGSVCWSRCDEGFTDIGALCTRGAVTRGKGCCCISTLSCKGFVKCKWKKSCCDNCDSGFSDTGCTCFRPAATRAKDSYIRAPKGSPFQVVFKDSYVIAPQIPTFRIPGTSF